MRPALPVAASAAVLLLAAVAVAPAASAAWGFPDALTSRGKVVEDLFGIILLLGALTFLVVFVWLVAIIWRFRESTGHGRATHERERHSAKMEAAWIGVPLVMVLAIGVLAYAGLVELDHGIPREAVELEVRVTGSQWNWMADYGNGVQVFANPDAHTGAVDPGNAFLVPAGANVLFNVTSSDVIHAFQVLDANRAYVAFVDANPLGQNAHNLQAMNLPPGNYTVQCNKMCLNPGHAYMKAAIRAVPRAEFDHWLAEKRAEGGASLLHKVKLQVKDGHLVGADGKAVENLTLIATTRLVFEVPSPPGNVLFRLGPQQGTVAEGEAVNTFVAFDLPKAGNYTLSALFHINCIACYARDTRTDIPVSVIQAIPKTVEMGDFEFIPPTLALEAGKTYLVTVPNVHSATHDLHIGHYNGGTAPEVLAHSPSVGASGTGQFLVTPPEKGTFDMWCSQPGHVGLGMISAGSVTVT